MKKRHNPRARTSLQEVLASETIVAFAPSFLDDEVRKELAAVALEEDLPLETMLIEWSSYRQRIRFYEAQRPAQLTTASPSNADPKDTPYIETYLAVGAAAIITADSDLERMRAHTVRVEITAEMRSYARSASVELSIKFAGFFAVTLSAALVAQLVLAVRWVTAAFRRLPPAVQVITGAAILAALLHRPTRERLLDLLGRGWTHAVDAFKVIAPALVELSAQAENAGQSARAAWTQVDRDLPIRRIPIRAHVLAACAAASTPLTEHEIQRYLERAGVKTSAPSFPKYLRRVLRKHMDLIELSDGRWRLRQEPVLA